MNKQDELQTLRDENRRLRAGLEKVGKYIHSSDGQRIIYETLNETKNED